MNSDLQMGIEVGPVGTAPKPVPPTLTGPAPSSFKMLIALQGQHLYQGTVPDHIKAKRRARGKVAKQSRKINRRSK